MIRDVDAERDAGQIAEIYREYVEETTISFETKALNEEEMKKRINTIYPSYPYFVWEEDGEVKGYCYAHPWKERAAYRNTLETTIYLSPDAKGRGTGSALMDRLEMECRNQGYRNLIACITLENEGSCNFHEKRGYTKVSHFKGVGEKFGRLLDVVDYQKVIK